MIPAPPTAQLGDLGWVVGVGVQLLSALGLLLFVRHRGRAGFSVMLAITWALPIDLAIMQWLAGGWDAPYHELLLPALILGSAGLPPRRFAPFAAGVAAIAMLPALYAPNSDELLVMVTELTVWLFVTMTLSMLMTRVRGQARLARSDPLTGLANRRALDELFERPTSERLVLAIGDLDNFKQINDCHGHLAGDSCLAAVAAALTNSARAGDRVFRWAGDEFAILLPGATPEVAVAALERLEAGLGATVREPGGNPVSITFGWAYGEAGTDLRDLIAQADENLIARKDRRPAASAV